MIQASKTFQVVCLNFHLYSIPTPMVFTTNNKKSTPWIGPKTEDNRVIPKMYFKGTDTKTNTSNDSPSTIANNRNLPILELKKCFI